MLNVRTSMKHWLNDTDRTISKYYEKSSTDCILSSINPTWPSPALNAGLRGERLTTDSLSHWYDHPSVLLLVEIIATASR